MTVEPIPAGLTVRVPRVQDAEAVTALVVACDLEVLPASDATVVQVAADLAARGYDAERGGALVTDAAGSVVGWLWSEDDVAGDTVYIDAYAHDPALTAWLLGRGVAYVQELATERGRPLVVDSGAYEQDEVLAAALSALGLTVRRRFYRMRLELGGGDWPAPPVPDGVIVRRPDPEAEDTYRVLHALIETAFTDHWDHVPHSYEEWRGRFAASAGPDPQQWWLAEVGGEPAAVVIGDDSRVDVGMGWVRTVAVLREYRGRGLARFLLRTAFAWNAEHGRSAVGLSVDAQSPTGATALYESVGMRPESVILAWKRELEP